MSVVEFALPTDLALSCSCPNLLTVVDGSFHNAAPLFLHVEALLAAGTLLETGLVDLELRLLFHCGGLPHFDHKDLERDTEIQG